MASSSDVPDLAEVLNKTANITSANMTSNGTLFGVPLLDALWSHKDMFWIEVRMVLSALSIIYFGAHASLRRPPSAAPPAIKKNGKRAIKEPDQFMEGLQASDAILFPLMAGAILIGLYYLIKWLQDPSIISTIISTYLAVASVISSGKMFGDGLDVLVGFLFPNVWADSDGQAYIVVPFKRSQSRIERGTMSESVTALTDVPGKRTPFPTRWSEKAWLAEKLWDPWTMRRLLKEEWTVNLGVHGFGRKTFSLSLTGVMGALLAAFVSILYATTGLSLLNNIMGLGLCYGTFMIMSCTSFPIGSMVLVGLFVYDIVMVFYT